MMYQLPIDMMTRMISVPLATQSPPRHSASRPYGLSTTSVAFLAAGAGAGPGPLAAAAAAGAAPGGGRRRRRRRVGRLGQRGRGGKAHCRKQRRQADHLQHGLSRKKVLSGNVFVMPTGRHGADSRCAPGGAVDQRVDRNRSGPVHRRTHPRADAARHEVAAHCAARHDASHPDPSRIRSSGKRATLYYGLAGG